MTDENIVVETPPTARQKGEADAVKRFGRVSTDEDVPQERPKVGTKAHAEWYAKQRGWA